MVEIFDVSSSPRSPSGSTLRGDGFEYDVFLSFRGADTRKGFTGHLYEALKVRGVETFIDGEKLEKGQKVEELFGCIQRSKIFVPVFSKSYADSKWCLKEIAKMVECRRLIIPVFFDVEPRDVRQQTGPFTPAFESYRKEGKIDIEEVSKWADALRQVGGISGYNLADTEGDEAKLIRLIVKTILTEVKKAEVNEASLFVAKHEVGLDCRIADVMKLLELEPRDDVRMVGIFAMGGMGKTTLAKAVYNQISSCFGACCFISNVRETAGQSSGLVSLQKQLLRNVCKDETLDISSIDQGIGLIKVQIQRKKILLILDDVDNELQLDALAGGLDWFGSGSRIIVTTRDKRVLRAPRVKQKGIYELKELDAAQSLQLFSCYAFGAGQPADGFAELAEEVAGTAGGLPLALTIFGSLFFDLETVEEWRMMLERLKKDQNKDIHEKLKISFDALDVTEKKIFLDIACFFIGEKRELPTLMWKDCGFFPDLTIKVLMHKSLININDDTDKFGMHDHIRDMGRKIVQDESLYNPGMCSTRLWKDDETTDALQNMKGTKDVEAIKCWWDPFERLFAIWWDPFKDPMAVEAKSFAAMPQLRMLLLGGNVRLEGECELFPKTLRWLQWRIPHPLKSLPACVVHLENIVILDLSWSPSITQVWRPHTFTRIKVCERLKVLNLSQCGNLMICPDFTRMPHLEKLDFSYCVKLSRLHPSIGQLASLQELRLDYCEGISTLPLQLGDLKSLRRLYLTGMRITTLPESICSLPNLEVLKVASCPFLASLPLSLGNLRSLRKLDFSRTAIEELPESMLLLENLKNIWCDNCERLNFSQASVLIRLMVLKNRNGVSSATTGNGGQLSIDKPSERPIHSEILPLQRSPVTELSDPDDPQLDSIVKQLEALDLNDTLWLMDALAIDESELSEARRLGISLHGLLRKRYQETNFQHLLNWLIPGSLGESMYARSLYLVPPEWFGRGRLFLILDGHSQPDSVVVHMDITRACDGRLLFHTSTQATAWPFYVDDDDDYVIYDYFPDDLIDWNEVPQVKLEWHDDGCLPTLVIMHVSLSGCLLQFGYISKSNTNEGIHGAYHLSKSYGGRVVVLGISSEVHQRCMQY